VNTAGSPTAIAGITPNAECRPSRRPDAGHPASVCAPGSTSAGRASVSTYLATVREYDGVGPG